jgi:hypothetical protein
VKQKDKEFKVREEELVIMASWLMIILAYVIVIVGVFSMVGSDFHPLF